MTVHDEEERIVDVAFTSDELEGAIKGLKTRKFGERDSLWRGLLTAMDKASMLSLNLKLCQIPSS